ncbi:hypothetical protein CPB86DRAFT_788141 [Serendipita vermifera]|nr:hypothetical protein CPB86DRAFT_788141 [Serendipita vermifera]
MPGGVLPQVCITADSEGEIINSYPEIRGNRKSTSSSVPPKEVLHETPVRNPSRTYLQETSSADTSYSSFPRLLRTCLDAENDPTSGVWAGLVEFCSKRLQYTIYLLTSPSDNQHIEASNISDSSSYFDLYLESLITSHRAIEHCTSIMDQLANENTSLGGREVGPSPLSSEGITNYSSFQPQLPPSNPIPTKATHRGQRVRIDRDHLRDLCENSASSLDSNCRTLLVYILGSDLYLTDSPEPELGTDEGYNILRHLEGTEGATFPQHRIIKGTPLSALLTDPTRRKCLICEKKKATAQRAVECVRSHLGYRPFHYGGASQGCKTCRPSET